MALLSFYRNLRIKHKLFLLLVLMLTVCIALTYSVLQYAYSIYDHQLYRRSSQVLNLSANSMEAELKRVENTTFNIVTDPIIQSKLSAIRSVPFERNYEGHQLRDEMVARLVQFAGTEKYVISADIIDLSGNVYSAGRVAVWPEELKKQIWGEALKAEGQMRWLRPSSSGSLLAVRLVRSYYSYLNLDLETLGVLVLQVRMGQIVEDVAQGTELGTGELLITSGQERIYPSEGPASSYLSIVSKPVASGYEIRDDGSHKVFISQMNSPYTGWTYSSIIPFDTIFRKIVWMKNLLIIGFSAGILLMTVLAFRVARGITGPIEVLIARMRQAQKGDFSVPALLPDPAAEALLPKDEIGQLHRTFRMMIQQIDELINENYAKQLTIKETQFKALQAQINPHFLYNTLESINWEAKMGGQPRISRMVEALGFLLRSSISQKESIVTLGYELDIINSYMAIQLIRFEERLIFEHHVPTHLHACLLPKLTLQPLVENAIHHALEPMVEPCHIAIRASVREDSLVLSVEDDGPGMTAEQLELVMRGEAPGRGNGIGLSNIRERLALAFGEGYGLHIESSPGQGTRVLVHIPYERSDNHV